MNKFGRYVEHPSDSLLDPSTESVNFLSTQSASTCDAAKLNPSMTCNQKNMYCTGLAFSVGLGVGASAGPVSIGGGIDFGFGIQDE